MGPNLRYVERELVKKMDLLGRKKKKKIERKKESSCFWILKFLLIFILSYYCGFMNFLPCFIYDAVYCFTLLNQEKLSALRNCHNHISFIFKVSAMAGREVREYTNLSDPKGFFFFFPQVVVKCFPVLI